MGFMSDGATMSWSDAQRVLAYVKEHGVRQFLAIYNDKKASTNSKLLWGDEVEYLLVRFDHARKRVALSLRGHDLLPPLQQPEHDDPATAACLWRPEYGSFMIEGTPGQPYPGDAAAFVRLVERSMQQRRAEAAAHLHADERALTLVNFPMLGMGTFCEPPATARGDVAQSLFTPDEIINHHLRFSTLTRNIRERRGERVRMCVPLLRDEATVAFPVHPDKHESEVAGQQSEHWPEPYQIYMDSMAFGMGMCCLQMTFQCCNIDEARMFYDQLAVLAPIMLALSANAPIYRGFLAEQDARWNVIAGSVDDRTELERTPVAERKGADADSSVPYLAKSRYDSISLYLSNQQAFKDAYNDLDPPINESAYKQLRDAGVDEKLSRHLAHYFIRDPLVMYESRIELDDENDADHFENIQSTNWQTVRFKPPPPHSKINWRVEFRPLEVQLTDFENAAFVTFIVLLTRVLMAFDLNLYTPISMVDKNMKLAHRRDAVTKERFWFRTHCTRASGGCNDDEYASLTIDEIMNGRQEGGSACCDPARPGLIELINVYLDTVNIVGEEREAIDRYLTLISQRASGKLQTGAAWQRNFVRAHPAYKKDSIVTQEIAYDLCVAADEIAHGKRVPPELLGDLCKPPLAPK